MISKMKAAIFVEPGRIVLDEKPIPDTGPSDAFIRTTTTTICGTDIHMLKGEYPAKRGLTIGHAVGVIEKLGSAVRGYSEGQRGLPVPSPPAVTAMPAYAAVLAKTAPAQSTGLRQSATGNSAIRSTAVTRLPSLRRGPIGLCATAAARLCGASVIISVTGCPRAWKCRAGSGPIIARISKSPIRFTKSCV